MQFKVVGQHRDTGSRMEMMIDASSKAQAERKAMNAGLVPHHVTESAEEEIELSPVADESIASVRPARRGSKQGYLSRRYGGPLDMIFSPAVRVLLALVLLGGFGLWVSQNKAVVTEELKALQGHSVDPTEIAAKDPSRAKVTATDEKIQQVEVTKLDLKQAPKATTLLGSWNAGAAGLLLLLSAFFREKMLAFSVILGAALAVFGPAYAPAVSPLIILGIGMGVGVLGIFFFRSTD